MKCHKYKIGNFLPQNAQEWKYFVLNSYRKELLEALFTLGRPCCWGTRVTLSHRLSRRARVGGGGAVTENPLPRTCPVVAQPPRSCCSVLRSPAPLPGSPLPLSFQVQGLSVQLQRLNATQEALCRVAVPPTRKIFAHANMF